MFTAGDLVHILAGPMKKPSERRLLKLLHHNWNRRTLTFMSWLVERFVFKGCFSELKMQGMEQVLDKVRAGKRLIFIPDHQSEYDWLILQSRMFRAGIRTAIQAGDNLFVGPLDPLLRGSGAFMSIRNRREFRSVHWMNDLLLKALGTRPTVVTREQYNHLYILQLRRILGREQLNLLVFPGYETDPYSGEVKYGRSYSGELNPLSPFVFMMVSRALRDLQIDDAEYIPVAVTYERVPEDVLFREFKAKTRKTKIAKYIYDHYYTFVKAPFSKELHQSKGRALVRFGEGLSPAFDRARDFAELIRRQIGRLTRVYPSTIVFGSLQNKFILPKTELRDNVLHNVDKLHRQGIDCSPLYGSRGQLYSLDALLNRVESLFNFPQSPIIPLKSYLALEHDKNEVFIHNPHLAAYYGNKLKYILSAQAG